MHKNEFNDIQKLMEMYQESQKTINSLVATIAELREVIADQAEEIRKLNERPSKGFA